MTALANIRMVIRECLCQQLTCYNGLLVSCQSSARVVGGGGHFTSAILGSVLSEISDFQLSWGFMVSLMGFMIYLKRFVIALMWFVIALMWFLVGLM